ncbi:MAG: hypothetical protein GQ574_19305 [Crocinitomix sp.]|nr:hypothetical protein [Crocinitomix sp.]
MRFLFPFLLLFLIVSCDDSQEPSLPDSFHVPDNNTDLSDTTSDSVLDDNVLVSPEEITYPTQDTFYYKTGEINRIIYYPEVGDEYTYTYYYKSGGIKQTGKQGDLFACGGAVDTSRFYDLEGDLESETVFTNWLADDEGGCHATRIVMSNINYYKSGKIKSTGQIETCYECDECPCGKWEFFDESGNLTKTEDHGDCFDSKLGCLED